MKLIKTDEIKREVKQISVRAVIAAISLISVSHLSAQEFDYDFSDAKTGSEIYYNVTADEYPLEIAVAFGSYDYNSYSGVVNVPEKVFKGGGLYAVTSVWENAFAYSKDLTEVIFPANIKQIGDGAFMDCKNLKKVSPLENVEDIGTIAFYGCASLDTLSFGSKLSIIGDNAFNECKSLKAIIIKNPEPPTVMGTLGKTKAVIYVPKGSLQAYQNSEYWKKSEIVEMAE